MFLNNAPHLHPKTATQASPAVYPEPFVQSRRSSSRRDMKLTKQAENAAGAGTRQGPTPGPRLLAHLQNYVPIGAGYRITLTGNDLRLAIMLSLVNFMSQIQQILRQGVRSASSPCQIGYNGSLMRGAQVQVVDICTRSVEQARFR